MFLCYVSLSFLLSIFSFFQVILECHQMELPRLKIYSDDKRIHLELKLVTIRRQLFQPPALLAILLCFLHNCRLHYQMKQCLCKL